MQTHGEPSQELIWLSLIQLSPLSKKCVGNNQEQVTKGKQENFHTNHQHPIKLHSKNYLQIWFKTSHLLQMFSSSH